MMYKREHKYFTVLIATILALSVGSFAMTAGINVEAEDVPRTYYVKAGGHTDIPPIDLVGYDPKFLVITEGDTVV